MKIITSMDSPLSLLNASNAPSLIPSSSYQMHLSPPYPSPFPYPSFTSHPHHLHHYSLLMTPPTYHHLFSLISLLSPLLIPLNLLSKNSHFFMLTLFFFFHSIYTHSLLTSLVLVPPSYITHPQIIMSSHSLADPHSLLTPSLVTPYSLHPMLHTLYTLLLSYQKILVTNVNYH